MKEWSERKMRVKEFLIAALIFLPGAGLWAGGPEGLNQADLDYLEELHTRIYFIANANPVEFKEGEDSARLRELYEICKETEDALTQSDIQSLLPKFSCKEGHIENRFYQLGCQHVNCHFCLKEEAIQQVPLRCLDCRAPLDYEAYEHLLPDNDWMRQDYEMMTGVEHPLPMQDIEIITCFDACDVHEGYTQLSCGHTHCLNCLRKSMKASPECPAPSCGKVIDLALAKRILGKEEYGGFRTKILQRALKKLSPYLWNCPFPDCSFMHLGIETDCCPLHQRCEDCEEYHSGQCAACSICGKVHGKSKTCRPCKKCGTAHPSSQSCGYSIGTAELREIRSCPRCSVVIDKVDGCNHVQCKCGHEFCFACRRPWQSIHICL